LKVYVSEDEKAKRKAMDGMERRLEGRNATAADQDAKLVGALARAIRSAMENG
jgi:hypothetical protein